MEFTIEEIKRLIDLLPEHYLVLMYDENNEAQVVAFSSGMPELIGLTDQEFSEYVGTAALDLILPADRRLVYRAVEKAFYRGEKTDCVYRAIHKTRGYIWAHIRISFSGSLSGKRLAFISVGAVALENEAYEAMLDSSVYAACTFDKETGEVLYVNERYTQLTGKTVAECLGHPIRELSDSHDELCRTDILDQTCLCRDSENGRIFDIRGTSIKWGVHDAVAVFISDVTEQQRQTVEAAVAAKEHLDTIMHMNSGAMSTFRLNLTKNQLFDGVSAYPNLIRLQEKNSVDGYVEDALSYFSSKSEQELFARRFSREQLLAEYEAGRTQVSMRHHYMLADREHRILNTIVHMVQNKVTKDIEGIIYTLDVTNETYYTRINEILFDNVNIGISVINIKSSTFIMPQASPEFAFSASDQERDLQESVERTIRLYVAEEEKEQYRREYSLPNIIRHLDQDGKYTFRSRWVRDGQPVHVSISFYYVDEAREQIIVLAEDITEITRKEQERVEQYRMALQKAEEAMRDKSELERELKAALEEAKKANHAKSEFLSSMSHDIRTPLNAIINLTNLLHEELEEPVKLKGDIQKIEVAGEFLLQLINDVLDVSKIESGKMVLSPRVYTYDTFLNYIRGIIVPLCEDKDIHFILDEGPTALDIYMDRVRFHQIFFNILSNAVKYTPPGGTITFRTTNNVVHDGILTCDFIVTDTGCGMSQEFIEKAFDPFEREDSQNAYIGTGLGLSICKRILDLMGGTISIESELGKGTSVTVHMDLQIATEEQRRQNQAELNSSYHRHVVLHKAEECRILVVEDNEINREIISRLLEKKKYIVECAEHGREAVEKIESHESRYYQLVLMDIRMPVMDGLEATALIRQNPDEEKRHIPIVAITANAFEEDAQECLKAGMNSYLAKPIAPNALYEMIANYIKTDEQ